MKKIISDINTLGRLHRSLIEPQNITTIISKIHSNSKPLYLENNDFVDDLKAVKGLYVFYAKFPFRSHEHLLGFGSKWGFLRDKDAPDNCPRFHKSNSDLIKNRKLLLKNQYVPFYLGKSEKIQERVLCHVSTELDKTVYALKLRARENILKGVTFKLGCVEFDINDDSYFCIELLEKEVRSVLRPIIGKQ